MLMRSDILPELLINFLNDFWAPPSDLIIDKINFLAKLISLFFLFLLLYDLLVQLSNLRWESLSVLPCLLITISIVLFILHLKLMELRSRCLMVNSKIINFALIFGNRHQQLRISLFSSQKPMDNLIYIWESSIGSNVLKRLLDSHVPVHLFFHLFLHERGPKFLNQKFLKHFDLILVLVFVRGHISYFLLASNSLHSPFEGLFLILDRLLKGPDSLSSLLLVLINLVHNELNFDFGLDPLLFCFHLLIGLFCYNIRLRLHWLKKFLGPQGRRN